MRTKVTMGLAQIAAGSLLGWAVTLFLTVALALGDVFDPRGAFTFSSFSMGIAAVGVGAVSQSPTSGYWQPWEWVWVPYRWRYANDTPPPLTSLGVAIFVAPQLFVAASIAYG